jgi:Ca-activated chloride channel family protein
VTFESPWALLLLVLVPLAAAAYVAVQRHRPAAIARFANPALFPNLLDRRPRWRRHVPAALLLVALAALLVGVARPHATISVRREDATIVLAIDVSRSMVATDVAPSRLTAARAAARTFLAQVPKAYRIGVVAFATRADVVAPATRSHAVVESAIAGLRPGEGTAIGDAIAKAIQVAQTAPAGATGSTPTDQRTPAAILLLSDGAQTQGDLTPAAAARRAQAQKIPVYTVALGTPNGVVERTLPGGLHERIRVPPDPQTLRQVATATGGEFYAAPDQQRLKRVYEQLGSRLGRERDQQEVTFAFAAGGGILTLVAGLLSELWFRRIPSL